MKKYIITLFISLVIIGKTNAQKDIVGVWYNTLKTGKVQIIEKDGKFFGKIIWLKEPLDEKTGKPKTDINNPDANKHKNAIIGLNVLSGFKYEDGVYVDGKIYDPENGKLYSCKMTLKDKDHLDVRGYIGFSLLGRTENWTRAAK